MMRSLWIAKTGMDAMQTNIAVVSNNLANVNTNGFKKSRAIFEDLLYQTLRQPGAPTAQANALPSGLQIGTGVQPTITQRIHTAGNTNVTGNDFDVSIGGEGFFQVSMPDGSIGYTRDGAFQVDREGVLRTASGYGVIGPITIPQQGVEKVSITPDGSVRAKIVGQLELQTLGNIQLANFVNPSGMQAVGQNVLKPTSASGEAQTGTPGQNGMGLLNQGFIETSNVNVTEELINMITAQRAYEINSRSIQSSDQMLQKLSQL